MPDLRDVLAAEAARGGPVATPPFETVIARARHLRVVRISIIVAIVVAVGAVVTIPRFIGRHRTAVVTADGTRTTTEAARKAITKQAANQFADAVLLPPGAIVQPSAPSHVLAEQTNSPATQNLVDAVRFFTVPGTLDSVLAFVSAHPPKGMFENGSESSGADGVTTTQGVIFSSIATHDYGIPVVRVEATRVGTSVGVRVDADLVWRPLRTAAEQVPVDAKASLCRFTTTICAAGYVALDQPTARELAAFFNSLDTQPPGDQYCTGVTSFTKIEFPTADVLAFNTSSCGGVTVTAGGIRQPTLELPDAIPGDLETLLGLKADLASAPASDPSAVASFAVASASAAPLSSPAH